MAINGGAILLDGTVSASGGTSTTLLSKGENGETHKVLLNDGAAFVSQKTIDFSVKEPRVSAASPSGYTQARCVALLKFPKILADGSRTVNTLRMEFSSDINTTDAERLTMRSAGAQLLVDSDITSFWNAQSLT